MTASIRGSKGFTIVELLIVIVVIAILAAITIVAYNGIQQRAINTAKINAAAETVKAFQRYYAIKGAYPPSTGDKCVTIDSGCTNSTGTAYTVPVDWGDTDIVAPRSVPDGGGGSTGIRANTSPSRLFDGKPAPLMLSFSLAGANQDCGLANVVTGWTNGVLSTTGNSGASSTGDTVCYVAIPLGL